MVVAGQRTVLWSKLHLIVNGKSGCGNPSLDLVDDNHRRHWILDVDNCLGIQTEYRLLGFARGYPPNAMSFKTDGGIDITNREFLCRMERFRSPGSCK